jgi:hypothetical protein
MRTESRSPALLAVLPPEDRVVVRRERVLDEMALDHILELSLPMYLCDAIKGTDDMTLAEIKSEFDPFHGQSVEENIRSHERPRRVAGCSLRQTGHGRGRTRT